MLPSGIGRPPLACDGSMLRASFRLCYAAQRLFLLSILLLLPSWPANVEAMRPSRRETLKQATIEMFYHGFDNYMSHAFPEDEVGAFPQDCCETPPADPAMFRTKLIDGHCLSYGLYLASL